MQMTVLNDMFPQRSWFYLRIGCDGPITGVFETPALIEVRGVIAEADALSNTSMFVVPRIFDVIRMGGLFP